MQQPFQQNLHQPKSELLNCQLNHLFTSFLLSLSPINTLLVHHLRMILIPLYIVHLSFNNSFVQQPIANDIHTQFRLDCRYILQVAPQGTRLIIFLGTTIIMWYQRGTRYLTIPPFIAVSSSPRIPYCSRRECASTCLTERAQRQAAAVVVALPSVVLVAVIYAMVDAES